MAEQGLGGVVRRQALFRVTKDRKLGGGAKSSMSSKNIAQK